MTDFLPKPSVKFKARAKTTAKVAGGGLTAGAVAWMFATFVSKSEMAAFERRAERAEQFQRETWQKLMDVEIAMEGNREALEMVLKLRAGRAPTNTVATNR